MNRQLSVAIFGLTCLGAGLAIMGASACDPSPEGTGSQAGPGAGNGGGATTGAQGTTTGFGGTDITVGNTGSGGGTVCDQGSDSDDVDQDGFTEFEGDCNDCDELTNPDAVEVIAEGAGGGPPAEPVDEDCDGLVDNVPEFGAGTACDDSTLAIASEEAADAAKAIGLCKFVTDAKWVVSDGSPAPQAAALLANFHLGHGILPDLGPNNPAQQGDRLLALSSGIARSAGDPAFDAANYPATTCLGDGCARNFIKGYQSNHPPGFPLESPSCAGVTTGAVNDATGLSITLKAPSNAKGFSFDFNFFTEEWPKFICEEFNDFFVALMSPAPMQAVSGNISFDPNGNPISVNAAFLDLCGCTGGPPCLAPPSVGQSFACTFGTTGLEGTNFDFPGDNNLTTYSNGASGWLRTTSPVTPGQEFTIRLVTYDSADGKVDSLTLIDNWQWSATPGEVITEIVVPD